jgi:hypothetical protein
VLCTASGSEAGKIESRSGHDEEGFLCRVLQNIRRSEEGSLVIKNNWHENKNKLGAGRL